MNYKDINATSNITALSKHRCILVESMFKRDRKIKQNKMGWVWMDEWMCEGMRVYVCECKCILVCDRERSRHRERKSEENVWGDGKNGRKCCSINMTKMVDK